MNHESMTGREILEQAMRQYDKKYCDRFPPMEMTAGERAQNRRASRPFLGWLAPLGRRAAGAVLAVAMLLACGLSHTQVASSACTTVSPLRIETTVVDSLECYGRSEYTDREIRACCIIRSLRGADPVTLESRVGVAVTYTTGETEIATVKTEQKTVFENYDGTYASTQVEFDTEKIVSHFAVYHWYYSNGEYVYGNTYFGDYGVDNY